ncbi:transcriptional regulator, IclR family [Leptothrix cholodnii SP-6]|uniref:Transcriptional regulator, IclR family n=1 Tax=Leptothrix cholodnii (strain ATCC 51168 / LMG 8142 / SP-6) TaxID=395495 RepID=B1Y414_LEPCP|nr:IclR family transcriptional regulator [Leptothrix cholodnii]ACB34536.1 transcriptional regulator, IclR family [Leptothrix cholodnii SP-6]
MSTAYTHEGQQRILRLVMLLAGHEITGLAPADIAKQQQCNASAVTRDLANLAEAGFAELVPETGRWRLAPQVVQIAIRHMTALDRAQARLDEIRGRFSRSV